MRAVGEFVETISERAGLTNLRAVGERLKTSQVSADGSDLLDFGQLVIAGMRSTTGAGAPDTGALFSHGQVTFNRAGHTLQSASPDDRWEGAGSRAYADQNTRQQLRTVAMSDADREVLAERVPVAGQDDFEARRPRPCATVRLDPDSSPGPPAGMSPQDTN